MDMNNREDGSDVELAGARWALAYERRTREPDQAATNRERKEFDQWPVT